MFEAAEIKRLIESSLPGAVAIVIDEANDGEHFVAEVMSPSFVGQSLVKQHQAVYGALGARMGGAIHALALKTYTPEQWQRAGKA
jgi:stress-induced morphogen